MRRRKIEEWSYTVDGATIQVLVKMCNKDEWNHSTNPPRRVMSYTFEAEIKAQNAPNPGIHTSLDSLRQAVDQIMAGLSTITWRECLYLQLNVSPVKMPLKGSDEDKAPWACYSSNSINVSRIAVGQDRKGGKFTKKHGNYNGVEKGWPEQRFVCDHADDAGSATGISVLIDDTTANRTALLLILNAGIDSMMRVLRCLRPGEVETALTDKLVEGTRKIRVNA